MNSNQFVLNLTCKDQPGIVARVAERLFALGANIVDSAQYGDASTGRFFMRVQFDTAAPASEAQLAAGFDSEISNLALELHITALARKPKTLIMVSKLGHCLNDLLFRHNTGALPIEVVGIVSNHRDFYQLAASYNIPFHHIPVTSDTKPQSEQRLRDVMLESGVELVVLARYMQVLSEQLCRDLAGRCINIHHSSLPSFKGARPYYQAFDRGVKVIGATAHFVTPDLDEGPIIEQDTVKIDHRLLPEELTLRGRDVECQVLARAVRWYAERRVFLNQNKTVVFN
jgi:formyltetrahydrofolate deformylase